MAKTKAARSTLGANPFETPKAAAPMRLLSLDPQARPPEAAPAKKAEPAKKAAPARRAATPKLQSQPAPEPETAEAEQPSARDERPFAHLEAELAHRFQAPAKPKSADLDDEQIARISELLSRLERADLPEPEQGVVKRIAEAWRLFSMFGRSMTVDDFGLDPRFAELVAPIFDFLYYRWWRVEATGLDNIPASGRALIVANHSGMLPYDGGMIKWAVRQQHPSHREVRPLVEDFVYHFPFLGALMARIGGVRASQDNAQRLLEKDELVAVFPEGVKGIAKLYRYRYQLQRFGRGGFVKLCLRTGAPIIPTAVVGAEEIHPIIARADFLSRPLKVPVVPITPTLPLLGPLGMIPLPTKWFITFGKPIDLSQYGKAALDDEILINKITSEVRTQIQEQIYEQLKKRRSVFFG